MIFYLLGLLAFCVFLAYSIIRARGEGTKAWWAAVVFAALGAMVCLFMVLATLLLVGGIQ